MEVYVNGSRLEVASGEKLGAVLAANNLDATGMAVGVNNKLVKRCDWDSFELVEGARIVVIKAVCGG